MNLSTSEHRLLQLLQSSFPLELRPYRGLARQLGTSEEETLLTVQHLRRAGVIRRIGGQLRLPALGYRTALVGLRAPETVLGELAAQINSSPVISHNYLRQHRYNLWFTVAYESSQMLEEILAKSLPASLIPKALVLPAVRMFKLDARFVFDHNGGSPGDTPTEIAQTRVKTAKNKFNYREITPSEKQLLNALTYNLPESREPYRMLGLIIGREEDELIAEIERFIDLGVIARLAATVKHQSLGYRYNAMVVWDVPDERIDELGRRFAQLRAVSHCYQRQQQPAQDWHFNLYTMVHARTEAAYTQLVAEMKRIAGSGVSCEELRTVREFKKESVHVFPETERKTLTQRE